MRRPPPSQSAVVRQNVSAYNALNPASPENHLALPSPADSMPLIRQKGDYGRDTRIYARSARQPPSAPCVEHPQRREDGGVAAAVSRTAYARRIGAYLLDHAGAGNCWGGAHKARPQASGLAHMEGIWRCRLCLEGGGRRVFFGIARRLCDPPRGSATAQASANDGRPLQPVRHCSPAILSVHYWRLCCVAER